MGIQLMFILGFGDDTFQNRKQVALGKVARSSGTSAMNEKFHEALAPLTSSTSPSAGEVKLISNAETPVTPARMNTTINRTPEPDADKYFEFKLYPPNYPAL